MLSVSEKGSAAIETALDYPPCPQCRKNLVRRSRRRGIYERTVSLLYVYPFRCQHCAHRFLALQWGTLYERYYPDEQ